MFLCIKIYFISNLHAHINISAVYTSSYDGKIDKMVLCSAQLFRLEARLNIKLQMEMNQMQQSVFLRLVVAQKSKECGISID